MSATFAVIPPIPILTTTAVTLPQMCTGDSSYSTDGTAGINFSNVKFTWLCKSLSYDVFFAATVEAEPPTMGMATRESREPKI